MSMKHISTIHRVGDPVDYIRNGRIINFYPTMAYESGVEVEETFVLDNKIVCKFKGHAKRGLFFPKMYDVYEVIAEGYDYFEAENYF